MRLPGISKLLEKRREKAEKAFSEAVGAIGSEVRVDDLPPSVRVLNPRLRRLAYSAKAFPTGFTHAWHGDITGFPAGKHLGAVLATLSPQHIHGEDVYAFERAALRSGPRVVMFNPDNQDLDRDLKESITSFSKVVLHFTRLGKPVVFLTTLQKVTGWSNARHRNVDKREAADGVDRHLLHLALAVRIIDEMKKRGVKAELHVPEAHHFNTTDDRELNQRIRGPFETLAHHFKPDKLRFSRYSLNTVNLSRPRSKRQL